MMDNLPPCPRPTLDALPAELVTKVALCMEAGSGLDVSPNGVDQYVLDVQDICNLRLVNRKMGDATLYAFAKSAFTSRKHILNQYSLQALKDISEDVFLRDFVQELTFSPIALQELLGGYMWDEIEQKHYIDAHKAIIDEQNAFRSSEEPLALLRAIFENLPNLKRVCIGMYPLNKDDELVPPSEWMSAYGVKNLLHKLGDGAIPFDDAEAYPWCLIPAVVEDHFHFYYNAILEGLLSIEHRKDWTVDFHLYSLGEIFRGPPFELSSPAWENVRRRIRHLSLRQTSKNGDARNQFGFAWGWINKLMLDCTDIQSLSVTDEALFSHIFRYVHWPNLQHLTVRDMWVSGYWLLHFMRTHANSLKSIEFESVEPILDLYTSNLDGTGWDDYVYAGSEYWKTSWTVISTISIDLPHMESLEVCGWPSFNWMEDFTTRIENGECLRSDHKQLRYNIDHLSAGDCVDSCRRAYCKHQLRPRARLNVYVA